MGRDPINGDPLGRAFPAYKSVAERIVERTAALAPDLGPAARAEAVISNKVQTVLDGKWRSLDGRPMHAAVVALSELHEAVFADHLTRTFGVEWEARDMGRDRNPAWAIASVSEELVAEFSTRAGPHPGDNTEATGRSVLFGVLQHIGAELSAHETITAEQDAWASIAQLAAEYETIAAAAQHDRWVTSSEPPGSPTTRPTTQSPPTRSARWPSSSAAPRPASPTTVNPTRPRAWPRSAACRSRPRRGWVARARRKGLLLPGRLGRAG